jgi:hypothetical protein
MIELMKKNPSFILLLLALMLSACTHENVPMDSATVAPIYTSAAMTAIAKSKNPTATPTPGQNATVPAIRTVDAPSIHQVVAPILPTAIINSSEAWGYSLYSPPNSYSAFNGCHNAAFLGDLNIPDGKVMPTGTTFVKSWKFRNTGNCPWRRKFSIVFSRGDEMGGSDTQIDKVIDPGATAKISLTLITPDTEGTYTGYWSMADAGGNPFGAEVYVRIIVSKNAASSAP